MVKVNLWELITTIADKDLSNSDKCQAIKSTISPRFGSELTLEISDQGIWIVEVFNHEDPGQKVTLAIWPDGDLDVTRCRKSGDILEKRTVSF